MENNFESFEPMLGQISNIMIDLCEAIIDVRDKINTDNLSKEERNAQVEKLTRLAVAVEKIDSALGNFTELEKIHTDFRSSDLEAFSKP